MNRKTLRFPKLPLLLLALLLLTATTACTDPIEDSSTSSKALPIATFTFEAAKSDAEREWGLMGRSSLPEDHGMLFLFSKNIPVHFWTIGCLMDLSVAYIDNSGKILELHELPAFPNQMDPSRPVRNLKDLHQFYPWNDPVRFFFREKGAPSEGAIAGALEMSAKWFADKGIRVGDRIEWNESRGEGKIYSNR